MRQARSRFLLLPLLFVLACVACIRAGQLRANGHRHGPDWSGSRRCASHAHRSGYRILQDDGKRTRPGLYDFAGLNPANYNLKVTAKGFESFAQNGIVVNVSATVRADVKLTVGAETRP